MFNQGGEEDIVIGIHERQILHSIYDKKKKQSNNTNFRNCCVLIIVKIFLTIIIIFNINLFKLFLFYIIYGIW